MQYICDQNWVKLSSLTSMGDMVSSACRDRYRPFDLISMSQAKVHTLHNFSEIGSNNYEDIVFTLFSGSLPATALTFDL